MNAEDTKDEPLSAKAVYRPEKIWCRLGRCVLDFDFLRRNSELLPVPLASQRGEAPSYWMIG